MDGSSTELRLEWGLCMSECRLRSYLRPSTETIGLPHCPEYS